MTSSTQLRSVNECLHSTSWNLSSYAYLVIVPDCGFHMEGLGLYKTDNGGYQLRHTHYVCCYSVHHGNRKVPSCILFNSNGKRLPFGEDQFTNYIVLHLTSPKGELTHSSNRPPTRGSRYWIYWVVLGSLLKQTAYDMNNLAELKKEVVNSLHLKWKEKKKSAVEVK